MIAAVRRRRPPRPPRARSATRRRGAPRRHPPRHGPLDQTRRCRAASARAAGRMSRSVRAITSTPPSPAAAISRRSDRPAVGARTRDIPAAATAASSSGSPPLMTTRAPVGLGRQHQPPGAHDAGHLRRRPPRGRRGAGARARSGTRRPRRPPGAGASRRRPGTRSPPPPRPPSAAAPRRSSPRSRRCRSRAPRERPARRGRARRRRGRSPGPPAPRPGAASSMSKLSSFQRATPSSPPHRVEVVAERGRRPPSSTAEKDPKSGGRSTPEHYGCHGGAGPGRVRQHGRKARTRRDA